MMIRNKRVKLDKSLREEVKPGFIKEVLSKGRVTHKFLVGYDKFDRKVVVKSGYLSSQLLVKNDNKILKL